PRSDQAVPWLTRPRCRVLQKARAHASVVRLAKAGPDHASLSRTARGFPEGRALWPSHSRGISMYERMSRPRFWAGTAPARAAAGPLPHDLVFLPTLPSFAQRLRLRANVVCHPERSLRANNEADHRSHRSNSDSSQTTPARGQQLPVLG